MKKSTFVIGIIAAILLLFLVYYLNPTLFTGLDIKLNTTNLFNLGNTDTKFQISAAPTVTAWPIHSYYTNPTAITTPTPTITPISTLTPSGVPSAYFSNSSFVMIAREFSVYYPLIRTCYCQVQNSSVCEENATNYNLPRYKPQWLNNPNYYVCPNR